jgi:hypothetical protein
MICTLNEGDRVVIIENEAHGTVAKVRLDILGKTLVYVELDNADFVDRVYHGIWTARPFELRGEGEYE